MRLDRVIGVLMVLFVIEAFALGVWVWQHDRATGQWYGGKERQERLAHAEQEVEFRNEFERTEHRATGSTVYERIYNTRRQSVLDLLERVAQESFPRDWVCSVKVEEFTKCLLLVQTRGDVTDDVMSTAELSLEPVLKYGGKYLSGVAIFDRRHVCRVFIDEPILNELREGRSLSQDQWERARVLALELTRFNGRRIEYESIEGLLYVHVAVYGTADGAECLMMLDTGASVSVLPLEVIRATGDEDLDRAPKQIFETANGMMICPMVERVLVLEGISSRQRVAVSTQDAVALLGLDFFEGKDYLIDSREGALYVWEK